jgi:8-oxo-dGTP pyrophosphatase MutT (NUDIX family)
MFTSSDSLNQFLHYASTTTTSAILSQRRESLQHLPVTFQQAAVLMPFDWNHGTTQIWLSQRSKQLRQHSGQIAFPGGKLEENENSITAAFRESIEETGLIRNQWHLAGTLPSCYIPSGFKVVPVLAWSNAHLQWQLNHAEVSEMFAIPLSIALDSSQYQQSIIYYQQRRLPVYHLYYQHWHIWGATACMLLHMAQCYQVWYRQMPSAL